MTDGKPYLRALDKASGEIVHQVELPAIPNGAPMSYMVGGRQYISVALGGALKASLVSYALPGD